MSEHDINITIKEFFRDVKKYNVDTNFSATNSVEVSQACSADAQSWSRSTALQLAC